jgi:class 3 adenylate cyclase
MANSVDQLASFLAQFGVVGIALTLSALPIAAAIASYVTRMGSQAKIDSLEGEARQTANQREEEKRQAEQRYSALQVQKEEESRSAVQKLSELQEKYENFRVRGALLQSQIEAIANEAADIAEKLDAKDYSVYVPAPTEIPGDSPDYLVFLVASGPQGASLRQNRVPMPTSVSGQVYTSGRSTITSPLASGGGFAKVTDRIINYKTIEMLTICLRYKSRKIGVVQFLNKGEGRDRFNSEDMSTASSLAVALAVRLNDFTSDPRNLLALGFTPRTNQYEVSLLFAYLSRYTSLFDTIDSAIVVELLNQYFEEISRIVTRNGGIIDQYIGDGALAVFNLDQQHQEHERAALAAAKEIRAGFKNMRGRWCDLGYQGTESVFIRVGLSSGRAIRAELGSRQARRTTFIGREVNSAAHACESGPRDRDTICMTQKFRDAVGAWEALELHIADPVAESVPSYMSIFEVRN